MPDSCSEYSDGHDYLSSHMHGHVDSHMLDVATSTHLTDIEAAAAAAAAAGAAAASYNPRVGLSPRSAASMRSDATVRLATPSPILRNSSSKRYPVGSLEEPLLPLVEEGDRSASGAWLSPDAQLASPALDSPPGDVEAALVAEDKTKVAAGGTAAAPSGEAVYADEAVPLKAAAAAAAGLPPTASGGRALRKFKTFAEGSRVTVVVPPSDASNGGAVTPKWHQLSPRAFSESGALTPERAFSVQRCTSVTSGGSIFATASRGASQQVMPLVQLLQVRAVGRNGAGTACCRGVDVSGDCAC
jgi:hypothetical protein